MYQTSISYRYHPQSQSYPPKNSMCSVVCNNGIGWIWGHTSKWCLARFGTFSLLKVYNSLHNFSLDLILLCNLLQCCGTISVLTNVNKSCGFSLFSDVQKCLDHAHFPQILESRFQIWICHTEMIQLVAEKQSLIIGMIVIVDGICILFPNLSQF